MQWTAIPINNEMREGDILLTKSGDGFGLSKILRITPFPDGGATAHVLLYEVFSTRPSVDDLDRAMIFVWHAPIALAAMEQEAEVLGNRPVVEEDLVGYFEFLKRTNFNVYLKEKGLSADEVITQAKSAYDEGTASVRRRKSSRQSWHTRALSSTSRISTKRTTIVRSP